MLIVFIITLFFLFFIVPPYFLDSLIGTVFMDRLIGILFMAAFIATIILFFMINDMRNNVYPKNLYKLIFRCLLFPFGSYEYSMAKYFKDRLPTNITNKKDVKKWLIQKFNHYNLGLSMCLVVLLFILLFITDYDNSRLSLFFSSILIIVIACRAFGRSVEIVYAFFNDAINPQEKTSSLTGADRLKLAVFSFFELLILFSGVYCVLEQPSLFNYILFDKMTKDIFDIRIIPISIINSFKNGTVVGADFVINVDSLLKTSHEYLRDVIYGIFVTLHTLTNLVLTIFSIAKYSSGENEIVTHESNIL